MSVDKPTLDEVFFAITGHGADTGGDRALAGSGAAGTGADYESVLEVQ